MQKKILNSTITEKISILEGVTAAASKNKRKATNEFASAGARSFTMEDVRRYPAAAFDPERMARSGAAKKNKQPGLLPVINYRKEF